MRTSARWINDHLDPPATAQEQAEILTRAGFPPDAVELLPDGDTRADYETTSNRGDCVSHVGLAREIAALSGRTLRLPPCEPAAGSPPAAAAAVKVTNDEVGRCPLYTARVIRGVRVGPSPAWMQERLVARGEVPRNNIVDATNFVLYELGQPTHVFDLAKLKGREIRIRMARAGERFLPIGEETRPVTLTPGDLVIADARDAVAIAGVKGGAATAVSESTSDILIEAATFDPVAVRGTSRRLGIASDSSYRFERGVHPAQVNPAAERLARLILELAGGTLAAGVVADGAPIPPLRRVSMRPQRCRAILGVPLEDARMVCALGRLGFEPMHREGRIECTVPAQRLDVEREIDLIEEVARIVGLDAIPVAPTISIRVSPLQPVPMARKAVADCLVGLGFVETVTHSLVSDEAARLFLPKDRDLLRVQDERARAEPALRPSLLPSLLRTRARNRDAGVGDLRLFEWAAAFWREAGGKHGERQSLSLLMDGPDAAAGLRPLRGVVERLALLLGGPEASVDAAPDDAAPWLEPGASVTIGGRPVGRLGVLSRAALRHFDLDLRLLAAELEPGPLLERFPPQTQARALPGFPAIERDVSAILEEGVTWAQVRQSVRERALPHLEAIEFVTTYRGPQIGAGRKSLTLRLRFRADDRTLRHEDVDGAMEGLMRHLTQALGAEIRR
jgi:phenylalanyl-tRNA synthetase beta chain